MIDQASARSTLSDGESGPRTAKKDTPAERSASGYTRRSFIGRSAGVALAVGGVGSVLAACGSGSGSGSDGEGEVVVVSWETYLTPEIQKAFKADTGITLRGIPAEADEDMFTKIKAGGGSQYDLVFCNAGWAPIYYENDLTEVFDLKEIPASENLFPVFRENTDLPYIVDKPDQALLYPNMWAALSLVWNVDEFTPSKPPSWNDLWKAPEGSVIMHGSANDFLAIAGLAQGVPKDEIYSMTGDQLQAASDYLGELEPFQISKNSEAQTASAFATSKSLAGMGSSLGIAFQANREASKTIAESVVPSEGSLGWIDGPQLVKDAKNRDNAMKFLDWFGGNEKNQDYMWNEYFFAQCSQTSTERVISQGGEGAKVAKSLSADKPETSEQLVQQREPDDAEAWTQAYDQVIG